MRTQRRNRPLGLVRPLLVVSVCVLLGRSVGAHEGPHEESESGSSKGGWSLLGTMCFPKGTDTHVRIEATAGANSGSNQKILFYDDQEGSWDAAVAAHTCEAKEKLAKKLELTGERQGMTLQPGVRVVDKITVREQFRRQWYFVASNCGKDGKESPVNLESFSIDSSDAIDCELLFDQTDETGWIVACAFSSLFAVILALTAVCFYRKSKPPTMPTTGSTGYNEL